MRSRGVRTPSDSGPVRPRKHLPTHVVGEAHAHVQGATLKACAAFLSEGFSTPRLLSEGARVCLMKIMKGLDTRQHLL
jgi:hypothetical protein